MKACPRLEASGTQKGREFRAEGRATRTHGQSAARRRKENAGRRAERRHISERGCALKDRPRQSARRPPRLSGEGETPPSGEARPRGMRGHCEDPATRGANFRACPGPTKNTGDQTRPKKIPASQSLSRSPPLDPASRMWPASQILDGSGQAARRTGIASPPRSRAKPAMTNEINPLMKGHLRTPLPSPPRLRPALPLGAVRQAGLPARQGCKGDARACARRYGRLVPEQARLGMLLLLEAARCGVATRSARRCADEIAALEAWAAQVEAAQGGCQAPRNFDHRREQPPWA